MTMTYADIHLSAESLSWRKANQWLLKDVDFTAPRGQFTGIIGPNGSGKTSLLRCLYGFCRPTSGCVSLNNQSIHQLSVAERAKRIAIVLQDQSTDLTLTVESILKLGRIPHQGDVGFHHPDWLESEWQMIEQLEVDLLMSMRFDHLSGGEKQRVMICRALMQKPEILILDEPGNHLDIGHQYQIFSMIKALKLSVICSLHDLNIAAEFCDQIAVMHKGRLVLQGSADDVLTEPFIEKIYGIRSVRDKHPATDSLRLSFYL
jgi:iron complex transport system ATP-binding protein